MKKQKTVSVGQLIGANIKKYRKEFTLNQEDLANAVGLSRVSIVNIEAGRQSPPIETLLKICSVLQCTPNDLFPPVPKSPMESKVLHISFVNKKAREKCLQDPAFVSAMNKLVTKAYYMKPKKT